MDELSADTEHGLQLLSANLEDGDPAVWEILQKVWTLHRV
jgi:hypothetical protein